MKKEAILFIASTGVLLYFIAPISDEETTPVEQAQVEKPKPAAKKFDADAEWEGDDAEDEEEEFVFGEPMVTDDDDEDYDSDDGDDGSTNTSSATDTAAYATSRPAVRSLPVNPKAGEPGSKSNPVVLNASPRSPDNR